MRWFLLLLLTTAHLISASKRGGRGKVLKQDNKKKAKVGRPKIGSNQTNIDLTKTTPVNTLPVTPKEQPAPSKPIEKSAKPAQTPPDYQKAMKGTNPMPEGSPVSIEDYYKALLLEPEKAIEGVKDIIQGRLVSHALITEVLKQLLKEISTDRIYTLRSLASSFLTDNFKQFHRTLKQTKQCNLASKEHMVTFFLWLSSLTEKRNWASFLVEKLNYDEVPLALRNAAAMDDIDCARFILRKANTLTWDIARVLIEEAGFPIVTLILDAFQSSNQPSHVPSVPARLIPAVLMMEDGWLKIRYATKVKASSDLTMEEYLYDLLTKPEFSGHLFDLPEYFLRGGIKYVLSIASVLYTNETDTKQKNMMLSMLGVSKQFMDMFAHDFAEEWNNAKSPLEKVRVLSKRGISLPLSIHPFDSKLTDQECELALRQYHFYMTINGAFAKQQDAEAKLRKSITGSVMADEKKEAVAAPIIIIDAPVATAGLEDTKVDTKDVKAIETNTSLESLKSEDEPEESLESLIASAAASWNESTDSPATSTSASQKSDLENSWNAGDMSLSWIPDADLARSDNPADQSKSDMSTVSDAMSKSMSTSLDGSGMSIDSVETPLRPGAHAITQQQEQLPAAGVVLRPGAHQTNQQPEQVQPGFKLLPPKVAPTGLWNSYIDQFDGANDAGSRATTPWGSPEKPVPSPKDASQSLDGSAMSIDGSGADAMSVEDSKKPSVRQTRSTTARKSLNFDAVAQKSASGSEDEKTPGTPGHLSEGENDLGFSSSGLLSRLSETLMPRIPKLEFKFPKVTDYLIYLEKHNNVPPANLEEFNRFMKLYKTADYASSSSEEARTTMDDEEEEEDDESYHLSAIATSPRQAGLLVADAGQSAEVFGAAVTSNVFDVPSNTGRDIKVEAIRTDLPARKPENVYDHMKRWVKQLEMSDDFSGDAEGHGVTVTEEMKDVKVDETAGAEEVIVDAQEQPSIPETEVVEPTFTMKTVTLELPEAEPLVIEVSEEIVSVTPVIEPAFTMEHVTLELPEAEPLVVEISEEIVSVFRIPEPIQGGLKVEQSIPSETLKISPSDHGPKTAPSVVDVQIQKIIAGGNKAQQQVHHAHQEKFGHAEPQGHSSASEDIVVIKKDSVLIIDPVYFALLTEYQFAVLDFSTLLPDQVSKIPAKLFEQLSVSHANQCKIASQNRDGSYSPCAGFTSDQLSALPSKDIFAALGETCQKQITYKALYTASKKVISWIPSKFFEQSLAYDQPGLESLIKNATIEQISHIPQVYSDESLSPFFGLVIDMSTFGGEEHHRAMKTISPQTIEIVDPESLKSMGPGDFALLSDEVRRNITCESFGLIPPNAISVSEVISLSVHNTKLCPYLTPEHFSDWSSTVSISSACAGLLAKETWGHLVSSGVKLPTSFLSHATSEHMSNLPSVGSLTASHWSKLGTGLAAGEEHPCESIRFTDVANVEEFWKGINLACFSALPCLEQITEEQFKLVKSKVREHLPVAVMKDLSEDIQQKFFASENSAVSTDQITPTVLAKLSSVEISALTSQDFVNLPLETLASMKKEHAELFATRNDILEHFTAGMVASCSPEFLSALRPDQIDKIPAEACSGLTRDHLTSLDLSILPSTSFAFLEPVIFTSFSFAQLSQIPEEAWSTAIFKEQIESIDPAVLSQFTSFDQFGTEVDPLSPHHPCLGITDGQRLSFGPGLQDAFWRQCKPVFDSHDLEKRMIERTQKSE